MYAPQLRLQNGLPGQLIFYKRKDVAGPKLSDYDIARIEVYLLSCLFVSPVPAQLLITCSTGDEKLYNGGGARNEDSVCI